MSLIKTLDVSTDPLYTSFWGSGFRTGVPMDQMQTFIDIYDDRFVLRGHFRVLMATIANGNVIANFGMLSLNCTPTSPNTVWPIFRVFGGALNSNAEMVTPNELHFSMQNGMTLYFNGHLNSSGDYEPIPFNTQYLFNIEVPFHGF